MLNKQLQDQTTYLNEKYERLTTDYEKRIRQMAMEIRSRMGDPCVPFYWLHDPSDNQLTSSSCVASVLLFFSSDTAFVSYLLYLKVQMFKFIIST
jgi:hypothetical protein